MRALSGLCRTALMLAVLAVAVAGAALAQATPDYESWEATASRAEEALSEGRASNNALETLRADIAEWREKFLAAQDENAARLSILQGQIAALGPAPAEGEEEPSDIAARRAELNAQLAELRAPVVRAEEAYNRADGIIRQIDATIRERQTSRIFTLGPSPLNPVYWPAALEALIEAPRSIWIEAERALASDGLVRDMQGQLPLIGLLLAVAAILLWRGRTWVFRFADMLRERTRRGTGVWTFLASVGLILVPMAGLILFIEAVQLTGFVGLRGSAVLDEIAIAGVTMLVARWLGVQLFSEKGGDPLLPIAEAQRSEAHWDTVFLGMLVVAASVVDLIVELQDANAGVSAVLTFPVIALAGLVLFRFGQVLVRGSSGEARHDDDTPFRVRASRLLGRAMMGVGIVGPALAAIGYTTAAGALMMPTVISLGLLGLLLIIQRFITDLYTLVTRTEDADAEGLIPTLLGFLLFFLSVPVFALIWGARVAELSEIWTRFREGFTFGETRISPTDFLTFLVVFAIGYAATRLLQAAMRSSVLPKTRIDPGGRSAIVSGLGYVGIFLAALLAITATGLDLSSLAIVAGALSVGIGFGLQNIVSNFISGIILLVERPISEGDWIEVGGNMGYVRSISVRSTRIETFDRTDVIVPNADFISGTVTNYTRGNTIGRVTVPVGVAYGTDTKRVEAILRKIAEAHPMVLLNPPPNVVFQGFGADSLDFEIRAILRDVNWLLSVKSDLNHEIAKAFAEEGIEIPFAQRDVWLRNPEVLQPAANGDAELAKPADERAGQNEDDTPRKAPEIRHEEDAPGRQAGEADGEET